MGRSPRINCVNNLKQVGLAYRVWSLDHNDLFPTQVSLTNGGTLELQETGPASVHYGVLSNELNTPKVLLCPTDRKRTLAVGFGPGFSDQNLSYFIGVDANPTNVQMFLSGDRNITNGVRIKKGFLNLTTNEPAGWTDDFHQRHGNVGLADGSVQQFSSSRLRAAIAGTGVTTNRLLMP
jgi:hypothetical protein